MCEQKGSHFLDGLVFGGMVGVALGLMFAPATGEKFRLKIKEKLKDFNLDEIIDKLTLAFEEGKKEAQKAMEEDK